MNIIISLANNSKQLLQRHCGWSSGSSQQTGDERVQFVQLQLPTNCMMNSISFDEHNLIFSLQRKRLQKKLFAKKLLAVQPAQEQVSFKDQSQELLAQHNRL